MVTGFDRITLAVPDVDEAAASYAKLLGDFQPLGDNARGLALSNVGIALQENVGADTSVIAGLTMLDEENPAHKLESGDRNLPIFSVPARSLSGEPVTTSTGIAGVDHLVLNTRDADDCIRLFNSELGMRLALDQEVPEWGGRMLFFRCGKMTLEVIQNLDNPVEQDHFWGITYLCPNLNATIAQLDNNGVAHSEIRDGRKPGTRVATVKSHDLGIPTLLIEPTQ